MKSKRLATSTPRSGRRRSSARVYRVIPSSMPGPFWDWYTVRELKPEGSVRVFVYDYVIASAGQRP